MDLDDDELFATKNSKSKYELTKEIEILKSVVEYLDAENKSLRNDKEYWMKKYLEG